MLVFAGTTPIGGLFVGWLAALGGTPFSMTIGMLLSLTAVPIVWLILRSQKKQAQILSDSNINQLQLNTTATLEVATHNHGVEAERARVTL